MSALSIAIPGKAFVNFVAQLLTDFGRTRIRSRSGIELLAEGQSIELTPNETHVPVFGSHSAIHEGKKNLFSNQVRCAMLGRSAKRLLNGGRTPTPDLCSSGHGLLSGPVSPTHSRAGCKPEESLHTRITFQGLRMKSPKSRHRIEGAGESRTQDSISIFFGLRAHGYRNRRVPSASVDEILLARHRRSHTSNQYHR